MTVVRPRDRAAAFERALVESQVQRYSLRLYIGGMSVQSTRALRAIRDLCEGSLRGRYDLEVIDVYQQKDRAREDDVAVLPTLVRLSPTPAVRLVGDLSDRVRVLAVLGLHPLPAVAPGAPVGPVAPRPERRGTKKRPGR